MKRNSTFRAIIIIFILIYQPAISLIAQSDPCGGGPEPPCYNCGGEGGENGGNGGGQNINIPVLHAFDPNDITGETGYGAPQWISVNDELGYTIRFENDPDFATAPAQIVRISSPIGPNLNINSFRLGSFGFGQFIFDVPENSSFYANRLDVIDSLGVYVDVTAGIDINKNEVFWIFESVDPLTNLPPEDALTGFLPVNDTTVTIYTDTITQRGEGFVNFTILPDQSSMTGDSIKQQASIIFDQNAPIPTNIWTNLIDALPPTSTMDSLPDNIAANRIDLSWSAVDDPGGVGEHLYDLYVSRDSGQYYLYQAGIDTTEFQFQGILGSGYAFYVRSSDYVGNQEGQKFMEDERVFLGEADAITLLNPALDDVVCADDNLSVEWEAAGSVDEVDIKLIRDDTQQEILIADDISSDLSPFVFPIPAGVIGGFRYSVCVTDATGLQAGANASIFIAPVDTTVLEVITCDPAQVGQEEVLMTNQYNCDSLVITNTILDNVPPEALCAAPFSVSLTGIGARALTVDQINQGSTDNCGIADLKLSKTQLSCSDYGIVEVRLTVTDLRGNKSQCATEITVNDPGDLCQCDGDALFVDDNPVASGIYNAKTVLQSGGKVNAGSSVTFKAGDKIRLVRGFRAGAGSAFRAVIDDCVDEPAPPVVPAAELANTLYELELRIAPNPFLESTTLRYTLPAEMETSLMVYDVNGRLVSIVQRAARRSAGSHEVSFSGQQLQSGIYLAILTAGEETIKQRMVLVR